VVPLIIDRTGLPSLVPGTLNIKIDEPYIARPDAKITAAEYNGAEEIKLQRCRIGGIRAVIMRPTTHEVIRRYGHGRKHFELLSHRHLRTALGIGDGDAVTVELEGDAEWWADES